jgi:2-polyprenyl-3-methyl-5-hydroxy-6-metoxy-1,4-benzoquinol methylase
MKCSICGNTENNQSYQVREMMLGLKDVFTYFECNACKCLQIAEIPKNILTYYPRDYYSYKLNVFRYNSPLKKILLKLRNQYALYGKNWLGKVIYNKYPRQDMKSLSKIKLDSKTSILDIGCGNGLLLYDLSQMGFENLLGADPFIEKDIVYEKGLKIVKKSIQELEGEWDVIMLHHSLEHMDNQADVFHHLSKLLKRHGTLIIRIPTVSSYAWEKYKTNWVSLDAPRHFFLHSIESITRLAQYNNLIISDSYRDSASFQIWGSEQYSQDVALNNKRSHYQYANGNHSVFESSQMKDFEKLSNELNQQDRGDQIVIYMYAK